MILILFNIYHEFSSKRKFLSFLQANIKQLRLQIILLIRYNILLSIILHKIIDNIYKFYHINEIEDFLI